MEAVVSLDAVISDGSGTNCADERLNGSGMTVSLPLLFCGEAVGAMCCSYPQGRRADNAEITLLTELAGHAASAVEHDRENASALERAALKERKRLSRELHDSISQTLYAISLGASTARELLLRDAALAAEPVECVRNLAENGIAELRSLLAGLRSEPVEAGGLVSALTRLVDGIRARDGIAVEARLGAEPATTPETRQALYRIAQEALHNVIRHSGARQACLSLLSGSTAITVVIDDDGTGFDPRGVFPGHLGLRAMRERAEQAGGTLEVESRPGKGTRVRATVPASGS
jgi:signal transduction histidine kinase